MNEIVASLQADSSGRARHAATLCAVFAGTPVLGLQGPLPAETVRVGTRLITRTGARAVTRVCRYDLPAISTQFLPANCLAPGIPAQDLWLPSGQSITLPMVVPHDRTAPPSTVSLRPKATVVSALQLAAHGFAVRALVQEDVSLFAFSFETSDYFSVSNVQVLSGPAVKPGP